MWVRSVSPPSYSFQPMATAPAEIWRYHRRAVAHRAVFRTSQRPTMLNAINRRTTAAPSKQSAVAAGPLLRSNTQAVRRSRGIGNDYCHGPCLANNQTCPRVWGIVRLKLASTPALGSHPFPNSPKVSFHLLSLPRRSVIDLLAEVLHMVSEPPTMFAAVLVGSPPPLHRNNIRFECQRWA